MYNIALLIITATISIAQVNYYFWTHLVNFNQELRHSKPYRDGFDAIMRTVAFPDNTEIYIISNPVNDQSNLRVLLGFLHPPIEDIVVSALLTDDVTPDFLAQLPASKNYAFFVEPGDEATVRLLRQFFELGEPQSSPYDVPLDKEYLLYFVRFTESAP